MQLLKKLNEIRKPIYKTVSKEMIPSNSVLNIAIREKRLTKKLLYESKEDPFLIAFLFNENFDILEYVDHLKSSEINNISYNIIKKYLLNAGRECIDRLVETDAFRLNMNYVCLSALKGEIYRINKFDILENKTINPFEMLGYTSILETYLDTLDTCFAQFVNINPDFVFLLDFANEKVRNILKENIHLVIDQVSEVEILPSIVELLDFDKFRLEDIKMLISKSTKLLKDQKYAEMSEIFINKIVEIEDLQRMIDVVFMIAPHESIFKRIRDQLVKRINGEYNRVKSSRKASKNRNNEELNRKIADVCYILKYYDQDCEIPFLNQLPENDREILEFKSGSTGSKNIIDEITASESDFTETAKLFAKFLIQIKNNDSLTLESILELPEKFFSTALRRMNTNEAMLIQKFHFNLCNQKIKSSVAEKIDRELFVKYLIKRSLIFDVDMDDYIHLMSDQYKILYAESNLRWASENIEKLFEIGVPRRLYHQLKGSAYASCLGIFKIKDCTDSINEESLNEAQIQKLNFKNFIFGDVELEIVPDIENTLNIEENEKPKRQQTESFCAGGNDDFSEKMQICVSFSKNTLSPGINYSLESLFKAITEFCNKNADLKSKVKNSRNKSILNDFSSYSDECNESCSSRSSCYSDVYESSSFSGKNQTASLNKRTEIDNSSFESNISGSGECERSDENEYKSNGSDSGRCESNRSGSGECERSDENECENNQKGSSEYKSNEYGSGVFDSGERRSNEKVFGECERSGEEFSCSEDFCNDNKNPNEFEVGISSSKALSNHQQKEFRENPSNTEFTENILEYSKSIITEGDFRYILSNLYEWCKKTKYMDGLEIFFNLIAPNFPLKYEPYRTIANDLFTKNKNGCVLENLILSLEIEDLKDLIRDFKDQIDHISSGLVRLKEKIKTNSLKEKSFDKLLRDLVSSDKNHESIIGLRVFSSIEHAELDVSFLLSSPNDLVIQEAIKLVRNGQNDEKLLEILFRRGVLDSLAAEIIRKIDTSKVSPENMTRIYQLFYLSPLAYIKYEIYKLGFVLNETIANELINIMDKVFDERQFKSLIDLFKGFEFTELCYNTMITKIETPNILFKRWIIKNLSTEAISLPYFIKLCLFISNENDLEIVRDALKVVRRGKIYDIVDKWADMKKLERLNRRIYPLRMKDKKFYRDMLTRCKDLDEVKMLKSLYKDQLQ